MQLEVTSQNKHRQTFYMAAVLKVHIVSVGVSSCLERDFKMKKYYNTSKRHIPVI